MVAKVAHSQELENSAHIPQSMRPHFDGTHHCSAQLAALGAALSLVVFSPGYRAAGAEAAAAPPMMDTNNAQLASSASTTQQPKYISGSELEAIVAKVVAQELAHAQTNAAATAQQERIAELVLQKFAASAPVKSGSSRVPVPTNAWQIAKGIHQVEEKVEKTIGWNLNTIVSGLSSSIVLGTAFWLISMPFFGRYPNEFDIKLADLREHRDPSEEYGVEPLFGRTEVDVLLGKPKAMSNRLLHVFLPEKWSLLKAQLTTKFWPAFSFLRFKEASVFNALGSFLKVNALDKNSVKAAVRHAHVRLVTEVQELDGEDKAKSINPTSDGEEIVSVLTYERWATKVNRVLAIPAKDLCALLANPARYFNRILAGYSEVTSPVSANRLHNEMIGFMRRLEVAVGVMERHPEMLRRLLPHQPATWEAIERNAHALRPVIALNTTDGICYVTKYIHEMCSPKSTSVADPDLLEKRGEMLGRYRAIAPQVESRGVGELYPTEERRLAKLWYPSFRIGERVSQGFKFGWAGLSWMLTNKTWPELRPRPLEKVPYKWFGEVRMPDPCQ